MSIGRDAISFVGEGLAASSTSFPDTRYPQRSHDVQAQSDVASPLPSSPSSVRNNMRFASGPTVPNSSLPSQVNSSEELILFFRNYLNEARSSVERVMCDTYDVDCHLEAQENFLSSLAEKVDATDVPESETSVPSRLAVDWEDRIQNTRGRIGHIQDHDREEPLEIMGTRQGLESIFEEIQDLKSRLSSSGQGHAQHSRLRAPVNNTAHRLMNDLLDGVRQEFMGISSQLSGQVLQVSIYCRQASNVATEGLRKANCIREEMKALKQQLKDRIDIQVPALTYDREGTLSRIGEDQTSKLAELTARCEKAAKDAREALQNSKSEDLSSLRQQHQLSLLPPVPGSTRKPTDVLGGSETLVTRRDLKEVVEALMEEILQMTMQAMPMGDQGDQETRPVAIASSLQQLSHSSGVSKSREREDVNGAAFETAFSDFKWQSKQTNEEFKKELREMYKEIDRLSGEMVDTKKVLLADIEVRRSEIALQKEALFREIDSDIQTLKQFGSTTIDRVTHNDLREMAEKLREEFRECAGNPVSRNGDIMARCLPDEIAAATAAIKEAVGESIGASKECECMSKSVSALTKLHPEESDNRLMADLSAMKLKMEELQKITAAQITEKLSSIKQEMCQELDDKLALLGQPKDIPTKNSMDLWSQSNTHQGSLESLKLECDELRRRFDALEANSIRNHS